MYHDNQLNWENMRNTGLQVCSLVLVICLLGGSSIGIHSGQGHVNIVTLLSERDNIQRDGDRLSELFRLGDQQINGLVTALDDANPRVSLNAQIIIRYLGNEAGIKSLLEWYKKQKQIRIDGPIPLPLNDYDYQFIYKNYVGKPLAEWREPEKYIYALALDDAPRAKAALTMILENKKPLDESYSGGQALTRIQKARPQMLLDGSRDIASLVKENLFFLPPKERKYASVNIIGMNGAKDKILVEVYVNQGLLAERWFHVVLKKWGNDLSTGQNLDNPCPSNKIEVIEIGQDSA